MMTNFIDKLALIHLKNSKVLVTRSKGKDVWYLPGGKRESGETDVEALTREVKEEIQVELRPENARLYGVFEAQAHGKPVGTMVRMTCYEAVFDQEPKPANEIEAVDYFGYDRMEETSEVDHLIFKDLKAKGLIE